eukprot:989867-Rhodomonas_salina.5
MSPRNVSPAPPKMMSESIPCVIAMCPHRGDGCTPCVRTNVHDRFSMLNSCRSLRFADPFCPPKITIFDLFSSAHAEWNARGAGGVPEVSQRSQRPVRASKKNRSL